MLTKILVFVGLISLGISSYVSSLSEPKLIDLGYGYAIVGEVPVSQPTAKNLCDSVGKELVSIESIEEDMLLLSLLRKANFTYRVWTSGTNADFVYAYRWGNGEPMYYTRWYPNTPLYDKTYCVRLSLDISDRQFGGDVDCNESMNYPLCENKK